MIAGWPGWAHQGLCETLISLLCLSGGHFDAQPAAELVARAVLPTGSTGARRRMACDMVELGPRLYRTALLLLSCSSWMYLLVDLSEDASCHVQNPPHRGLRPACDLLWLQPLSNRQWVMPGIRLSQAGNEPTWSCVWIVRASDGHLCPCRLEVRAGMHSMRSTHASPHT